MWLVFESGYYSRKAYNVSSEARDNLIEKAKIADHISLWTHILVMNFPICGHKISYLDFITQMIKVEGNVCIL